MLQFGALTALKGYPKYRESLRVLKKCYLCCAIRQVRLNCLKQYPDNFGTTYEEELNSATLEPGNAIKFTANNNFAFGPFSPDEN